MPGLIEGSVPLQIEYAMSLPYSLLSAASLMCAVPEYAGLDDWLAELRAWLPADLREELCLLIRFPGRYQRMTEELMATLPADAARWSFERLLAYWQALPGADYRRMALAALAKGSRDAGQVPDLEALLARPAEWSAFLSAAGTETPPDLVTTLVCDGEGLKRRLLSALERFWREAYAAEFEATRPMMERSILQHRAARYGPDFPDVFVAVTGRLVPELIADLLPSVRSVTFVPSCYVGPYVAFMRHDTSLTLMYNCRQATAAEMHLPTIGDAALYPPLKALADETRLQILALLRGREMYAQEIVERLDISQPAVSRHLNLMVAARVLQVRREGNSRYYAINSQVLADLAQALAELA